MKTIILIILATASMAQAGLLEAVWARRGARVVYPFPTNDIISVWTMDGNAQDSVGTNDFSASGTFASLTTGKNGIADTAYTFTGDYTSKCYLFNTKGTTGISLNGASGATLSFWLYPYNYRGYPEHFFTARFNSDNASFIQIERRASGIMRFGGRSNIGDAFQFVTNTFSLASSNWVHLVGVYDYSGDTIKIYTNGVICNSASVSFSSTTFSHVAPLSRFDAWGGNDEGSTASDTFGYSGKIDQARLYKRALSDNEIYAIYIGERP